MQSIRQDFSNAACLHSNSWLILLLYMGWFSAQDDADQIAKRKKEKKLYHLQADRAARPRPAPGPF